MADYSTLMAQKVALEAKIAQAQAECKADGIVAVRALIAEHGLTVADVFHAEKTEFSAGAPKYRDPTTSTTWTGGGNWINCKDRPPFLISVA